ncbi:MAG: hypothetical protein AB7S78_02045 [Candidatus Omnitrophota bacterium]
MLKLNSNAGLVSMVEVIVTAAIFSMAFLGVYMSMTTMHAKGTVSTEKLKAAYAAKGLLDDLRQQVRADTWNTGNLVPGTYNTTVNGYAVSYTVSDVSGLGLRQVDLSITY